jgi:hypothetical protein
MSSAKQPSETRMTDAALDVARQRLGLSYMDLWIDYFALGGYLDVDGLTSYLHGHRPTNTTDHNTIVHALNEEFRPRARQPPPLPNPLTPPRPVGDAADGCHDDAGFQQGQTGHDRAGGQGGLQVVPLEHADQRAALAAVGHDHRCRRRGLGHRSSAVGAGGGVPDPGGAERTADPSRPEVSRRGGFGIAALRALPGTRRRECKTRSAGTLDGGLIGPPLPAVRSALRRLPAAR